MRANVTEKDLALYLADPGPGPPTATAANEFLHAFSAKKLKTALKTEGGVPITMKWYISELLTLLRDDDTKTVDRINILDRFRALLVLGAMQDPELARKLERTQVDKPKPMSDPFVSGEQQLRMAE